jgi:hypothetical protein
MTREEYKTFEAFVDKIIDDTATPEEIAQLENYIKEQKEKQKNRRAEQEFQRKRILMDIVKNVTAYLNTYPGIEIDVEDISGEVFIDSLREAFDTVAEAYRSFPKVPSQPSEENVGDLNKIKKFVNDILNS